MQPRNYSYPELNKFIVPETFRLKNCLKTLEKNENGLVFVCNKKKKLIGVVTDGDIRRYLIRKSNVNSLVTNVMKKNFVSLSVNSKPEKIREKFSSVIKFIPLKISSSVHLEISISLISTSNENFNILKYSILSVE